MRLQEDSNSVGSIAKRGYLVLLGFSLARSGSRTKKTNLHFHRMPISWNEILPSFFSSSATSSASTNEKTSSLSFQLEISAGRALPSLFLMFFFCCRSFLLLLLFFYFCFDWDQILFFLCEVYLVSNETWDRMVHLVLMYRVFFNFYFGSQISSKMGMVSIEIEKKKKMFARVMDHRHP